MTRFLPRPLRLHPLAVGVLCLGVGVLGASCRRSTPEPKPVVRVAAASDLAHAFEAVGQAFEQQRGIPVSFTFGASGLLAKQVREGAPFDVFASANNAFVDEVVAAGACDGTTVAPYAEGRLALWTTSADGSAAAPSLVELADARFTRIAIAHPEHAPYGKAAKDALLRLGLWDAVASRVVYGENVRQALQLAQTGNADAALVALSLVVNDTSGAWTKVDASAHAPIHQALVVCTRGSATAGGRQLAEFIRSNPGREIMRRAGFLLPGEELLVRP
jgi:molybdate transport system substrate-binding protein